MFPDCYFSLWVDGLKFFAIELSHIVLAKLGRVALQWAVDSETLIKIGDLAM
jgi:hypothetical protein